MHKYILQNLTQCEKKPPLLHSANLEWKHRLIHLYLWK